MHIRRYSYGGWEWLGVALGFRLHLICRLGRTGDCIPLGGNAHNTRPYIVIDGGKQ